MYALNSVRVNPHKKYHPATKADEPIKMNTRSFDSRTRIPITVHGISNETPKLAIMQRLNGTSTGPSGLERGRLAITPALTTIKNTGANAAKANNPNIAGIVNFFICVIWSNNLIKEK
jgi:hypothetical protein